jgi:hypothetical protein
LHVWVVREKLVAEVCKKWQLDPVEIINITDQNSLDTIKNLCLNFVLEEKSLNNEELL